MKVTNQYLHKLEELFAESDYILRYEKGSFKSGWCVLNDTKVILVNAFYPLEGKVNSLIEILRTVKLDTHRFTDKSKKLYFEITQLEIDLTKNRK